MDNAIITLIVLAAVIALSSQQQRCVFSRLDYLPCQYRNKNLLRAGDNEYTIHHTKLKENSDRNVECIVQQQRQIRQSITNLGTENLRILYSPGYVIGINYDNQLLVEFRVRCKPGQLAFFNVTDMNVQGRECCVDKAGNKKCQDYILIDRGAFGTTELCGNTGGMDSLLQLESGDFSVFFRTNEQKKDTGFEMYAICFEPEEQNAPGCLTQSDFNSVCTDDGSVEGVGYINEMDDERNRREIFSKLKQRTLTYKQLFPGYPAGLRINKDVARFHSQWRRIANKQGLEVIERNIFFNQTINYTGSTISVFDADGIVIEYQNVDFLKTFDASGTTMVHFGSAREDQNIFRPGPLVIVGRGAYFQQFVIDPRGLIPDDFEARDLVAMIRPLLNAVPIKYDFDVTDLYQTIDEFRFNSNFDDVRVPLSDVIKFPSIPRGLGKRQFDDQTEISESTLFVTLRNLEACNPVLRSQARSTLQVFEMLYGEFVMGRMNFTIECILNEGTKLECINDGTAAILPGKTTCILNDTNEQIPCEPFGGLFELLLPDSGVITKVVVRAINCNGQRAEAVIIY